MLASLAGTEPAPLAGHGIPTIILVVPDRSSRPPAGKSTEPRVGRWVGLNFFVFQSIFRPGTIRAGCRPRGPPPSPRPLPVGERGVLARRRLLAFSPPARGRGRGRAARTVQTVATRLGRRMLQEPRGAGFSGPVRIPAARCPRCPHGRSVTPAAIARMLWPLSRHRTIRLRVAIAHLLMPEIWIDFCEMLIIYLQFADIKLDIEHDLR